jgi:hypothetical protein
MKILRPIRALEHTLNPLHVYCRLVDTGLSRRFSVQVCQYYELFLFRWIACLTHRSTCLCLLARERVLVRHVTRRHNPPC